MDQVKVIGMTSTGAAKHKFRIVEHFQPAIMLVEEAAHVLESHVVAALTEHCKQMILIGDHQQLRPSTADYHLTKNFGLDVSLMERLVENGKAQGNQNWVQLNVQHRMRPEIASLVCPTIYRVLENHVSVALYPEVVGVTKNVFFVDHRFPDKRVCSFLIDAI
jgi:superfamily I DNA and/or RNA helicase